MTGQVSEKSIKQLFDISLILKGIDGALEVIGGLLLLVVQPAAINSLAHTLTQHELSEDPHDFIATHLLHSAGKLTHGATLFAAVYLLIHGISKLILVVAVLKEQRWAYPWMIGLLSTFIVYQLYRLTIRPTLGLTLLTLFDALVVWLTWHEYQRLKPEQSGGALH